MSGTDALEPLGAAAALVVVDMQRLFAENTEWQVPTLPDIVPTVRRLAEYRPAATLFTRFLTPPTLAAASGRWRRYYEQWPTVTLDRMSPEMLDLMPELAPSAGPESICDKTTFSAFANGNLPDVLRRRGVDTLVLAGVETDVCVLATALDAVDRGYRVVIALDAVTSWSREAHRAVIDAVLPRFGAQIDLATTDGIIEAWRS